MSANASLVESACKAFIDFEQYPVVICSPDHTIIHMNKFAIEHFSKAGGAEMIGRSVLDCHKEASQAKIQAAVDWLKASPENNVVFEYFSPFDKRDVYMIALRDENGELLGYFEKHMEGFHGAPSISSL